MSDSELKKLVFSETMRLIAADISRSSSTSIDTALLDFDRVYGLVLKKALKNELHKQ